MDLPCREQAIIDPRKLFSYLLSPTHPSGFSKEAFFTSMGFERTRWIQLESALRRHAASAVARIEESSYGPVYVIRASLTGPSGRVARVVSVWIIRHGERRPRFVTAYPEK